MNIQHPANSQAFLNLNMLVLNVDVLEFTNDYLFDFNYDEELVEIEEKIGDDRILFEQIQQADFSSYNPIMNIGGIYICLVYLGFMIIITSLMKFWTKGVKRKRKGGKSLI